MLAVQVHQEGADGGEDTDGRRAAVDPGAGTPLGAHLAPDDDPAVFGLHSQVLEPALGRPRESLEGALDHRARGTRPHRGAVAPAAKQQAEGVDQHRLAGTGLAGEDVQAGTKGEGDVRDGGDVADAEFGEHQIGLRSVRSPQWSLRRMRWK